MRNLGLGGRKNTIFLKMKPTEKNLAEITKDAIQTVLEFIAGLLDGLLGLFERILIIAAIVILTFWGYKIFVVCDGPSIQKATDFIKLCHRNWIGLLVFAPLLFYRLIALKILELEQAWNLRFRKKEAKPVLSQQGVVPEEV